MRPAGLRLALATVAALVLSGCWRPTWRGILPGELPSPDVVVLVGRFASVPPIEQYSGRPTNVILPDAYQRKVAAFFADDLAERFDFSPTAMPLERAWTAWMPADGWFFIEVPRKAPLFLRGFVYVSDTGAVKVEATARIPINPADRVVYVGELTAVRTGGEMLLCRSRPQEARKAALDAGRDSLLSVPWSIRPAEPMTAPR